MKKFLCLLLACLMTVAALPAVAEGSPDLPDVELWRANANGFLPVKVGGTMYNFYKEKLGVGLYSPYVEWNGGTTYVEQLSLRIAANNAPNVFLLYNGIETDLIKNGALTDLTDLLQEYCPHVLAAVPAEVWGTIQANDPTGEGRIWYAPVLQNYTRHGAYIRKDWLDTLGLSVPTTQEELVNVLRAFKEKDPNGNGYADEIPAGGRAEARWMDYLFQMYGVAMFEGYPEWDVYDGELTYSAVTPNMKDALAFVASLYQEGLLDAETLLNDKAAWDGKMNSGIVGLFYHIPAFSYLYAMNIDSATGVKPDLVTVPVISAPGYEGYVTVRPLTGTGFAVRKETDEQQLKADLIALDALYNMEISEEMKFGAEGMFFEYDANGKKVALPEDTSVQELPLIQPYETIESDDSMITTLELIRSEDANWAIDQAISNVKLNSPCGKIIAGDGLPNSIYEGHEDIKNRTLYVEYASKIITGEWSIDKFDEFVEKWYAQGGKEVEEAARAWYALKSK